MYIYIDKYVYIYIYICTCTYIYICIYVNIRQHHHHYEGLAAVGNMVNIGRDVNKSRKNSQTEDMAMYSVKLDEESKFPQSNDNNKSIYDENKNNERFSDFCGVNSVVKGITLNPLLFDNNAQQPVMNNKNASKNSSINSNNNNNNNNNTMSNIKNQSLRSRNIKWGDFNIAVDIGDDDNNNDSISKHKRYEENIYNCDVNSRVKGNTLNNKDEKGNNDGPIKPSNDHDYSIGKKRNGNDDITNNNKNSSHINSTHPTGNSPDKSDSPDKIDSPDKSDSPSKNEDHKYYNNHFTNKEIIAISKNLKSFDNETDQSSNTSPSERNTPSIELEKQGKRLSNPYITPVSENPYATFLHDNPYINPLPDDPYVTPVSEKPSLIPRYKNLTAPPDNH
jgi:hypothetical protein